MKLILSLLLGIANANTITLDTATVAQIQQHLVDQGVAGVSISSTAGAAVATLSWTNAPGVTLRGTRPSLSGCGAGAALSAASADQAGSLTVGTSPGTCVLTLAWAPSPFPFCRAYNRGTGAGVDTTPTATGFTVVGSIAANDVLAYDCNVR